MKRILRAFGALVFALWGISWLVIGAIIVPADSAPVRELRQDELEAISIAVRNVSDHHKATGKYPTDDQFRAWASETRASFPQTTGLLYVPPFGKRTGYSFELRDGDCPVTWRAEPIGNTKAYIDPECHFLFGRTKLRALIWCFGWALLFLGIAYLFGKPLLRAKER
jgi:hypothetical protein